MRTVRHECKLFKIEIRKDDSQGRKEKRKRQVEKDERRREFIEEEDFDEHEW